MPEFQPLETDTPFLRLSGVSLRTPAGLAFRGTHWTWRRGEQWALLGPNGSGKSLLARALAGQVPVARGEIIHGFTPPPGRAHEDAVALVSFEQQHDLGLDGLPASRWFTLEHAEVPRVLDFLSRERIEEINPFEVGGPPRRSPAAFARDRRRILDLLRIGDLLDRDLLALSNGERRKILIARALLKKPKLLILDDPFAGLDAASRRHFGDVLAELIAAGDLHVLLVAMRPEELPRGITHVLRVDHCRLVSQERIGTARPAPVVAKKRSPPHALRSGAASATDEIIRMANVTIRYGQRTILRNLSWRVRRGESWAILGPNGSGKTTLLSLVTGDNPQAYANEVFVCGKRRGEESLWELRRHFGVVSPDEHLHCDGDLRCGDVACAGWDDPEQDGPTPQQRRASRHWMKELGLSKLSGVAFGALSPGQQRLVLLARALARKPDVLVLDEPCQGLDEAHRRGLVEAVERAMAQAPLTVLYVTHHGDELPRGLAHVLRLKGDGRAVRSRVRGAGKDPRTRPSAPRPAGRRGTS